MQRENSLSYQLLNFRKNSEDVNETYLQMQSRSFMDQSSQQYLEQQKPYISYNESIFHDNESDSIWSEPLIQHDMNDDETGSNLFKASRIPKRSSSQDFNELIKMSNDSNLIPNQNRTSYPFTESRRKEDESLEDSDEENTYFNDNDTSLKF